MKKKKSPAKKAKKVETATPEQQEIWWKATVAAGGSQGKLGRIMGIPASFVWRLAKRGYLPWTDYSGKTAYSAVISELIGMPREDVLVKLRKDYAK